MSKKLLAAALAAAFLATGGVAKAADFIWKADATTGWVDSSGTPLSDPITDISVSSGNNYVWAYGTNSADPTITSITVDGGTLTVGDKNPSASGTVATATKLDLEVTNGFAVNSGTMTLSSAVSGNALTAGVSSIGKGGEVIITDHASAATTLELTDTLTNEGRLIVKGTLADGGTLDVGTSNGGIVNTGYIKFEENATYTKGGTGINNYGTYNGYDATENAEIGVAIDLSSDFADVVEDLLVGSATLAGEGKYNVGDIVVTGDAPSGGVVLGATISTVAQVALGGNLYFAADMGSETTLDAKGANLIVQSAAANAVLGSTVTLSGRNVELQKGGTYSSKIYAYGGNVGENLVTGAATDFKGTVIVNAGTTATTISGELKAGGLDIQSNTGLTNADVVNPMDVKIAEKVTLKNNLNAASTGSSKSLDMTDKKLSGTGTLDNTSGVLVFKGTTVENNPTILNSGTGIVNTDSAGLAALENPINNSLDGTKGIGTVNVVGDVASTVDVDWNKAQSGTLVWDADAATTGTWAGTVNLGKGTFNVDATPATATTLTTDSSITAAVFDADVATTNKGTIDAGVNLAGGVALTNDGGSIYVGNNDEEQDVVFAAGSTIVNKTDGLLDFGADTTFTGAGNNIDNTDGIIKADAGMGNEIANLATAINDFGTGAGKDVGTVDITGELTTAFTLATATGGDVSLSGVQTKGVGLNVNNADADVELKAGSTDMGAITGASVSVWGDATGAAIGLLTARAGNVDIDVSGDNAIAGANATGGDVNVIGSENVILGPVTATAAGGIGGKVNVSGNENAFTDVVAYTNGLNITGNENAFIGGLTGTTATLAAGKQAYFGGLMNTNIDVKEGGIFSTEFDDVTIADGFNLAMGANSTIETGLQADGVTGAAITTTGTGTVDLASTTGFVVSTDISSDPTLADSTYTVFASPILDNITIGGNQNTEIADVAALMALNNYNTVGQNVEYYYDDVADELVFGIKNRTTEEQFNAGLTDIGMEGHRDLYNNENLDEIVRQASYLTESDIDALKAAGLDGVAAFATVMNGIGGGQYNNLRGNQREAYAGAAWASGRDYAGSIEAVTDTIRAFTNAMHSRADFLRGNNAVDYDECGNVIMTCNPSRTSIWAGYTGLWGDRDRRGADNGYKYDAHGFNIGVDHMTSSGFGFGAAFGYTKGDFENKRTLWNDSDIDNYSFGLYATYTHASGVFTTISGSYTYSDYDMRSQFSNRTDILNRDRADFHSNSWEVGGEIGYDWKPAANLTVTPTLGLYYYETTTNRFNSRFAGTDIVARRGMKYNQHLLEMPVEVAVKYDIAVGCDSTLSLMAKGGYAYNFTNKGVKVSGYEAASGHEIGGTRYSKPGRSSWNVGGGVSYRYRNLDLGVMYEYYGRRKYDSHNLTANVGYSF